jgi:hypothetical protein
VLEAGTARKLPRPDQDEIGRVYEA